MKLTELVEKHDNKSEEVVIKSKKRNIGIYT